MFGGDRKTHHPEEGHKRNSCFELDCVIVNLGYFRRFTLDAGNIAQR
ncbi:MAG: hypothetical protein BWY75_02933 [bacterium ADurb.Bin425]|nr:MAG: hypothetical protein BWY75_02933 [bacterium ADurb.Bin425]